MIGRVRPVPAHPQVSSIALAGGRVPEVDEEIAGMGIWLREKLGVK
jgi:hypothetical protein